MADIRIGGAGKPSFPEPGKGEPKISEELSLSKQHTKDVAKDTTLSRYEGVGPDAFSQTFQDQAAAAKADKIVKDWLG